MERDFLVSAFMAAESEINLILDELSKEFHNKIVEAFQEPEEWWIERILAFTFKDEISPNISEDHNITKNHLIAAQKAKTLMLLQGLNAKAKLKQIAEIKNRKCLSQMMAEIMNSPENEAYFKAIIDNANPQDKIGKYNRWY